MKTTKREMNETLSDNYLKKKTQLSDDYEKKTTIRQENDNGKKTKASLAFMRGTEGRW